MINIKLKGQKMNNFDTSKNISRLELLKTYNISKENEGDFLLQVDWIIENAVYPLESKYTDNLLDLWNVYMPSLKLESIIIEYAKVEYPMIAFIKENTLEKFKSTRLLRSIAIKNYVKFLISQGETNRMNIMQLTFDLFKDVSDRKNLYTYIDNAIDLYFSSGIISQYATTFLKRFQDNSDHIYAVILNRLNTIQQKTNYIQNSRTILLKKLFVNDTNMREYATLISVLLCEVILDNSSDTIYQKYKNEWNKLFPTISFTQDIYTFLEKYEKPYIVATKRSIENIDKLETIKNLYKDSIIFTSIIRLIEQKEKINLKSVQSFWENEGSYFNGMFYLKPDFEKISNWLDLKTLMIYKETFIKLHTHLLEKIKRSVNPSLDKAPLNSTLPNSNEPTDPTNKTLLTKKDKQIANLHERIAILEIEHALNSEKENQIQAYIEDLDKLKEKISSTEEDTLSKFISLLDSKNYNYILGKLYRIAYTNDTKNVDEIKLIIKNLFEVMNIAGIDIYGELDAPVDINFIHNGHYRAFDKITNNAKIEYPGYKIKEKIILHPLVKEA